MYSVGILDIFEVIEKIVKYSTPTDNARIATWTRTCMTPVMTLFRMSPTKVTQIGKGRINAAFAGGCWGLNVHFYFVQCMTFGDLY